MIRWVLALAVSALFLTACTASFKAPKGAFSEVGKLQASGYEVTSAYNNSVYRWPGLTWSISGTYLPGSRRAMPMVAPEFSFEHAGNGQFGLEVAAPESCRSSDAAKQQLTAALARLWGKAGGLPSVGKARVSIVDDNAYVARYSFSLHAGRSYELSYWTPCVNGNGDTALFYGAMIALHEATHASLDMLDAESKSEEERERVAVGASACLYLALERGDPDFARNQDALADMFRQAVRLGETSVKLSDICESWIYRVQTASRRSPR